MRETGTIFNLQHYAVHDGPGIRVTVFLKGCPLRCWWCHNPESQTPQPDAHVGRVMRVSEVMREIEKDVIFFDESGGGVTFSGGEPLMQPEFLRALLFECQRRAIHTALDTSGYAPPDVFEAMLPLVDLVLYDLKLIDDAAHRQYTDVSNAPILRNLALLAASHKPLRLRFPVIPGITDTETNLRDIWRVAAALPERPRIQLLPYHRIAAGKYQRLGWLNQMTGVLPPTPEFMQVLQGRFEAAGLADVVIGG